MKKPSNYQTAFLLQKDGHSDISGKVLINLAVAGKDLFVITISRDGDVDRYVECFVAAVFMPDINFGSCRVTRLAAGAA